MIGKSSNASFVGPVIRDFFLSPPPPPPAPCPPPPSATPQLTQGSRQQPAVVEGRELSTPGSWEDLRTSFNLRKQ